MEINIYYPEALLDQTERSSWFELVKSKQRLEESVIVPDQIVQENLSWKTDPQDADYWILPMDWRYYYRNGKKEAALNFCREAAQHQKGVLSFTGGDYGITVPVPNNTIVYRPNGYRSKRKENERTMPVVFSDPVEAFFEDDEKKVLERPLNEKVVVGFCGMAPRGKKNQIREPLKILVRNLAGKIGRHPYDAQQIMSASGLRLNIMDRFWGEEGFEANYIIREQYRGGAQTPESTRRTTLEYYQNQWQSDLILCVRGGGNFSVRFYETLAMGRIPVFCDTDSPLPDIGVDWKEHVIWFEPRQIRNLPDIVRSWLRKKDMHQVFCQNRKLWKERLSLEGFWTFELNTLRQPTLNDI